jgi:hypothetical protein
MRLRNVFPSLLFLTGVCLAQDTNFSNGPQYLITSPSTLFFHSISTPSLSLGESQPVASEITPTQTPVPSETPTPFIPTSQTFFGTVYWGNYTPSELESRRLVTPSLSLSTENPSATTTESETSSASPSEPSVIEISSAAAPTNLPPSIADTGVTGMTDPESLRERGYGRSLGEFAAFLKSHKKSGARVLTNEDLERH